MGLGRNDAVEKPEGNGKEGRFSLPFLNKIGEGLDGRKEIRRVLFPQTAKWKGRGPGRYSA